MESQQISRNGDEQNISLDQKVSKSEKCTLKDGVGLSAEVSKYETNRTQSSKSTDSCDSDQDENGLVIDLDQIPDVVQTSSSERKMDNVFDRILSDVSFPCQSSKRIDASCSSKSLQKVDRVIKKESTDDTVRGLENLEHCLKEFEGKLKQNGGCSKTESKDKPVEVTNSKLKNNDKKLEDEMDALLSEFTEIKSAAVGVKNNDLQSNNSKTEDSENNKNTDNNCFDTNIPVKENTSNEISNDTMKESSKELVQNKSGGGSDEEKKVNDTSDDTISDALKETRKELILNKSQESSEEDDKTNETDTIKNIHNKNDVSDDQEDKSDGTEKNKTSKMETNVTASNPACPSITERVATKSNSIDIVNNESDGVAEKNDSLLMSKNDRDIAEKNELSSESSSTNISSSLFVMNEKAENVQNLANDERTKDGETPIDGIDTSKMDTVTDVSRVVYRYKGARQMSRDDCAKTSCKVCAKDSCICTVDNGNGSERNVENQTEKVHTVINPVRRSSIISNGVAQQQKTTAVWSKLGMRRCENCRFTTDDSSLFNSHSAICSRKLAKTDIVLFFDGKFNCQNCSYPTSIRKKFEEHIALHLMAEPYICMTCDITFESKKDIELHVKDKHLKETVKCGLKGSKRIGQIIDTLVKSERHSFIGRVIDRRSQKTPLETKSQLKVPVQNLRTASSSVSLLTNTVDAHRPIPVTVSSSSVSKSKENDVIFVSASTVTSVNTCNTPAKTVETINLKQMPPQTSVTTVTTQRPLILVPVNNMNGNLFIPLSGVPPQTAQTIQNPCTKVSTSTALPTTPVAVNNQFLNITPLRFGPQNITLQGNQIRTNAVPQNIETSVKSNPITTPSTIRIGQNFTIQGNTIQSSNIQQGSTGTVIPPIGQVNTINMQSNQTRYLIIPPGPLSSVVGPTQISNQQQNNLVSMPTVVPFNTSESFQTTVSPVTNNTTVKPVVAQTHSLNSISLTSSISKTIDITTTSSTPPSVDIFANCPPVTSNSGASHSEITQRSSVVDTDGNKLFFRKCGELYMCDFCKSETPLEDAFKEHIWKHFHELQKICKECPPSYNSSAPCNIVLKVMVGLLNPASNLSTKKNLNISNTSKEIVMISDDEEDISDKKDNEKSINQNTKGEIVLTVDSGKSTPEPIDESSLQLKITSTFSLSDTSKSDSEENKIESMNYTNCKTIHENNGVETNSMEIDMSGENDDGIGSTKEQNEKTQSTNDPKVDSDFSIPTPNDTSKIAIMSNDALKKDKKLDINSFNQSPTCSDENGHIKDSKTDVTVTEKGHEHQISMEGKDKETIEFAENTQGIEYFKRGTSCSEAVNENTSKEVSEKESDKMEGEKADSREQSNSVDVLSLKSDIIKNREMMNEESSTSLGDCTPFVKNTSAKVNTNSTGPPHDPTLPNISNEENIPGLNDNASVEMDRKPIAFPLVAFYKCGFDACDFNAATSHEFRDHLSQAHSDAVEYKCAHCGHKSFTEDSHIRHLLFHSKPQNSFLFQCGIIGCRFRANILHMYKDHLEQVHQNVILYRCHSCKDGFSSVRLLIEHLQNNLLKFVQCPYCSMKDGIRKNVLTHIANCHPGKPRQINVTSQLICQERETNEYDRAHTKLASNEIPCIENLPNSTGSTGNKHQNKNNLQEGESCSSDTTENDPEDEQMIRKITSNPSIMGATYYRCHSCTYLGIGHAKLNKHTEMHKSGFVQQSQRTFVCPECPQSVNILQQFISHLNLHVGDHLCNVYICQHCGFGTNLSNKIQHHVASSHGSNDRGKDYTERSIRFSVKVIRCKKCNAAFKTSQAHREHVLKSHGITTNEISGEDDLEYDKTVNENKREIHMSTAKTDGLSSPHDNEENTSKRRFTCNECGWATRKLSFLKHHLKKHFLGQDKCQVTLFKCNYCEFDSTSKLIISGHSQNMHAGKVLRVKRIVETIYINESPENDLSIDKFHCDLCTFSCEKVSMLQTHLKDSHSGRKSVNESVKPKDIYIGPKREFLIPSGTVFRDVIQCSMCTFRTKKRIELLRHIKIHPSLEPKTESANSKDSQVAEKVQNPLFESYYKLGMKRKNSSDGNPVVKKARPPSPTISYDRIMMDTAKRDTGYRKQVATKSTTNRGVDTIKSMLYFLGGDQLHLKLKPCFSEFKESCKYYCLICNDTFQDKYKLHKHILQHMKVYFYKCAYCEHGTLDQTLIMVHIQREHRRAIQYSKLDVEEIDSHINKAIHDMKSQVESGKERITFEDMPKDNKSEMLKKDEVKENKNEIKIEKQGDIENQNNIGEKKGANVIKNAEIGVEPLLSDFKRERVSPLKISPLKLYQKEKTFKHWGNIDNLTVKGIKTPEDLKENVDNENKQPEDITQNQSFHPVMKKSDDIFICTICKDQCRNRTAANIHARAHSKVRRYMCSICQFNYVSRWPGDVKKHIDVKHRKEDTALCLWDDITPCDITPGGIPFNEHKFGSKFANPPMLLSDFNTTKKEVPTDVVESDISDIKLNNPSKRPLKIKLSLTNLSERKVDSDEVDTRKKIYKCLVCGKTFKSKHAIHQHLRIDCKDPLYGCSSCKFKNVNENTVEKHINNSHEEHSAEVVERSRCHKIRMYKVPRKKEVSKSTNKIEGGNKKVTGVGVLFKCIVCKRTFKNRNAAWYHAISALCNKTIKKCSLCDFKDVSEDKVESHIKKTHKDKSAKFVELPKEAKIEMIQTAPSLKMNRHKPDSITFFTKEGTTYKCRLCEFKCQNINSVIHHQNMHNSTPAYRCPYCDVMKSNYIKSVKNHIKLRHPKKVVKVKSLRSEIATFSNENENNKKVYPNATKNDSSENKCVMHKCLQCNYRCTTYSGVSRHIKRTESCNIPRFKCKECRKYSSINEIEVVEHMRTAHNSKETPEICSLKEMTKMIIVKKKSGDDVLKNKKTNKQEHVEKVEKSRMIEKFSGIKDIDTKVITCPAHSCNFKDKVIRVLEHYRKQHSTKIMKCKMCHLTSKSLGIMFMHFKDFHKLEDYFSTNFLVCSKTRVEKEIENTAQVEEIEKTKDDKNLFKTYSCDKCEYNNNNKNTMRQHIYRHLNYKKFMCRLCKAEFLTRHAVEKHLTVIHSTDLEEFDEIRNDRIEKDVEVLLDKVVVWKPREEIITEQDTSTDNDIPKKGESKSDIKKLGTKKENKECMNKVDTKKHSDTTVKKIDYTQLSADLFVQSNYIKEVVNKKTKEMEYLCKECPYKSIAKPCAMGHTYKHMPKCMKCPYCSYQGYPRVIVTKHVKAVHADKQAHVIDLRYQVSSSSQQKEKNNSKPKEKNFSQLKDKTHQPSPIKKRKKTFLDFDAEIFTSEGSSDEDDYDNRNRKIPEQSRKPATRERAHNQNIKTKYMCNFCDYHTDVLYLYRQHLTFHKGFKYQTRGSTLESKNKCGYCGYISTSSKEFDSHMEKHLNSRPFNCPYCSFSQYTQASVKYHIQNAHRGKKVEVLKDSTSSFLTGDGKVPQTLLVNFEPKVTLNDIFVMESDAFENLLITANVSVIDLHSIPDEQFGNVSKLLGVNGDGSDKRRNGRDDIEQTDGEDEIDGGSSIQIDERNYSDVSDDESNISCDDSQSGKIKNKDYNALNVSNDLTNTGPYNRASKQPQYEDVSDEEMDTENSDSMITVNGGKFFVKSELTYEDISDDDDAV